MSSDTTTAFPNRRACCFVEGVTFNLQVMFYVYHFLPNEIVNELRIEIGHVLEDITDAKKHYRDV